VPSGRPTASKKSRKSGVSGKAPHLEGHSILASVAVGRSTTKYAATQAIFRQGDPADAVFYIDRGTVQLTVISKQGKERVIAILGAGNFFGEGCLAGQPLHMASAAATAQSDIVRVEKDAMVGMLHEQPVLSEMFTAFLLSRNIQIEEDLIDQLFNSSEQRLARLLLILANFGKDGKLEPVIPNISQETLAARVGTTRSRINYFMNKFRKLGLIEYNGKLKLKVHSSLLNVIVHD
jgi:CRP/FNR family transcriptional regulator, cyclic AMP receptor protein